MREVADMKARPVFSALRTILLLSVMVLASCGGDGDGGGGGGTPAPVVTTLTVGAPVTDTVVFGGFNFYSAPVIPGALYKVSITGLTDDADLLVFGNDSTFSVLAQCAIDNTIIASPTPPFAPEGCVINAPDNTLFFGVDGRYLTASSAAGYTIDVELLTKTNITSSIPLPDSITETSAAVYVVSNTTATAYTVSITGLDDDADLYVFGNNGDFTSPAVCSLNNTLFSGTTPEDCTLTSSGGSLFFIVDGIFSTKPTVHYTALATPTPAVPAPTNEGSSSSPINVIVDTPYIGQVASLPTGTSYYAASVTAGQRYTVSITGMTGDVDLNVYDSDSSFSPTTANTKCLIDNTAFLETTPEDCTLVVTGDKLFFSVTSFTTSGGAAFINLVEPGP
jgi:hypothetical protein